MYILKQSIFSITVNSGRIFSSPPRDSINIQPLSISISKNNCFILSCNIISHIFLQQKLLCTVSEFFPGGDLENLLLHHGKLDESAVKYVVCTNNITQLYKIYSDPDEVDPKLVSGKFDSLCLFQVRLIAFALMSTIASTWIHAQFSLENQGLNWIRTLTSEIPMQCFTG